MLPAGGGQREVGAERLLWDVLHGEGSLGKVGVHEYIEVLPRSPSAQWSDTRVNHGAVISLTLSGLAKVFEAWHATGCRYLPGAWIHRSRPGCANSLVQPLLGRMRTKVAKLLVAGV